MIKKIMYVIFISILFVALKSTGVYAVNILTNENDNQNEEFLNLNETNNNITINIENETKETKTLEENESKEIETNILQENEEGTKILQDYKTELAKTPEEINNKEIEVNTLQENEEKTKILQENKEIEVKILQKREIEETEIKTLQENKTEETLNNDVDLQNDENNEENEIESVDLKEGVYFIASAIDNNKVIDISGGENNNCANVQLWQNENVEQQKFKIIKQSDGYYMIECCKSGKCLDIANGSIYNGNNVWQYEKNYTDAQKWKFINSKDGYYYIVSKCSDIYLNVANSVVSNGSNIQIYIGNGSDYQKFKFIEVPEYNGTQTIENGTYIICTSLNNNKVLEVTMGETFDTANIQIWENTNADQQKFIFTYNGQGEYIIESYESKKVLDVAGGTGFSGNNVWQYTSNNTNAQKWIIKNTKDGYYNIISKCGGYYLDVSGGKSENGTNIQIYDGNGTDAQKFILTKIENLSGIKTIENGTYIISTKLSTNMVIDVSGASDDNCANIQIWNDVDVNQQKFEITYLENGFYQIKSIKSNKVLDVAYGAGYSGNNVWQYETNNSKAQEWIIKEDNDGYFYIISKCGGYYLDVYGGKTERGTNIQIYNGNGTDAQKFIFNKVNTKGIDVSVFQGDINWSEVKNDKIDFAIIRVGFRGYGSGKIVEDSKYKININNATENEIDCGVYFVTQAINYQEGVEEANWVLNTISGDRIVCPVAIDVEWAGGSEGNNGRADYISIQDRTMAIKGFCEVIEKAGYTPIIYANKEWLTKYIDINNVSNYKVWLAHYVKGAPENKSDYTGKYAYWQYSSNGSVSRNKWKCRFEL